MALAMGNSAAKPWTPTIRGSGCCCPHYADELIIVLSSVLGATPFFRTALHVSRGCRKLSSRPRAVGAGDRCRSLSLLGSGNRDDSAGRGALCSRGRRKGIKLDFLFLLALLWASKRGLAIRPFRQRAPVDGNTRSLLEKTSHPPVEHDDLVAGRDNT